MTEFEVLMTLSDNTTQSVYRGHALDCMVAGLSPGRSYLFQVRASNKAGVSHFDINGGYENIPFAFKFTSLRFSA